MGEHLSLLPYPIAALLARVPAEAGAATDALTALHEGVSRTLGALALSSYVAGEKKAEVDEHLRLRFFRRAGRAGPVSASASDWAEVVRVVVGKAGTPAMPELEAFWKAHGEAVLRFSALPRDERRGALDAAIGALGFLAEYEVYVPLSSAPAGEGEVRVREAVRASGEGLARVEVDFRARAPLAPGDEVVVVKGGREKLRLSPLVVPDVATLDDADDLLFFDHGSEALLEYVGVRGGKRAFAAGSASSHRVAAFATAFGAWMPKGGAEGDAARAAPSRERAAFRAMSALVDDAARGVVGREDLLEEIAALAAAGEGALVLVAGPPGSGKTSALAALVRSGKVAVSAVHLAGADGGRDDPRLVARALAAQLCERFNLRRPIPDEHGAAVRLLHDLMRELGAAGERVVVVLDGLDELRPGPGGAPDLGVLPHAASRGVLFVASARPSAALDAASRLAFARRIDLAPLGQKVLLQVARAAAPDEKEAALVRAVISSEGNPLFLKTLLSLPAKEPGDTLPSSLEGAFEEIAGRLAKAGGIDGARALALLAVAPSGLSRRDLSLLLGASPFAVAALLREAREWLGERGGRFVVLHAHLREWLLSRAGARAELHADVAGVLAAQVEAGRVDALSDLSSHLDASGQREALLALASGPFPSRKAALLAPESVREDLVRAARAAGPDLARAAHHALSAALLARGADALTQAGVATAIARLGETRVAAAIARSLPGAKEREQALVAVAVAAAGRDRAEALVLCEEIETAARREAAASQVKATTAGAASTGASEVRAAAADVLASVDRALRVRALSAAAHGMAAEPAKKILSRAAEDALAEGDAELRDSLVIDLCRALSRVDRKEAAMLAEGLPRGLARVRSLAAAADPAQALAEATAMPAGAPREAAMAEAVEAMAKVDAKEASAHVGELTAPAHHDRAMAALALATNGVLAASKIVDPALRVPTLARIGEWEEAEAAADALPEAAARAAAHERMASVAALARDDARTRMHEAEAAKVRATIAGDEERASSLREASLLATPARPVYALRVIEDAAALDLSYEGTRATLLRRAQIGLAQPSLARVREAVALGASYGHAFADLFPEVVRALSGAFGEKHPAIVTAVVGAIDSSEKSVASLLCPADAAALGSPASLGEAQRAALEEPWGAPEPSRRDVSSAPPSSGAPLSAPPVSRSLTPPKDALDEAWGEMEDQPDTTREEPPAGKPPWQAPAAAPASAPARAPSAAPAPAPAPAPAAEVDPFASASFRAAPPATPASGPPKSLDELPRLGGDDDDDLQEDEFTAVMNRDQQKELREAIRAQKVVSLREERERDEAARRASRPDTGEAENKPTVPPPSERGGETSTTKPPPQEATTTRPPPGAGLDSGEEPALIPPRVPSFTAEEALADEPVVAGAAATAAPKPAAPHASPAADDGRRKMLIGLVVVLAAIFVVLVAMAMRSGK